MGVLAAMLAERLGVPQLTCAAQGRDRRHVDHRSSGRPSTATTRWRPPAGRRQRGREDQRAALPVLQGDHGGQEEAGRDAQPGRPRHRPGLGRPGRGRVPRSSSFDEARRRGRPGTIVTDEGDGGVKLAEFLAAAEVHLSRKEGCPPWLKSWSSSSTRRRHRQEGHLRAAHAGPHARRAARSCRTGPGAADALATAGRVRRGQGLRRRQRRLSTTTWSRRRPSVLAAARRRGSPGRGAGRPAPPRARRSPAGWRSRPAPASSPTPSAVDAEHAATQPVFGGAIIVKSQGHRRAPRSSRSGRTRSPRARPARRRGRARDRRPRQRRRQGGRGHRPGRRGEGRAGRS